MGPAQPAPLFLRLGQAKVVVGCLRILRQRVLADVAVAGSAVMIKNYKRRPLSLLDRAYNADARYTTPITKLTTPVDVRGACLWMDGYNSGRRDALRRARVKRDAKNAK